MGWKDLLKPKKPVSTDIALRAVQLKELKESVKNDFIGCIIKVKEYYPQANYELFLKAQADGDNIEKFDGDIDRHGMMLQLSVLCASVKTLNLSDEDVKECFEKAERTR